MSDLIYKQSVVNEIDGWIRCCTENDENAGIKSVLSLLKERIEHIESLPSADAVEVVRCKDCKHWFPHTQCGFDEDNDEYHDYCGLLIPDDDYYAYIRKSDDYCSYGERKGGEDE